MPTGVLSNVFLCCVVLCCVVLCSTTSLWNYVVMHIIFCVKMRCCSCHCAPWQFRATCQSYRRRRMWCGSTKSCWWEPVTKRRRRTSKRSCMLLWTRLGHGWTMLHTWLHTINENECNVVFPGSCSLHFLPSFLPSWLQPQSLYPPLIYGGLLCYIYAVLCLQTELHVACL